GHGGLAAVLRQWGMPRPLSSAKNQVEKRAHDAPPRIAGGGRNEEGHVGSSTGCSTTEWQPIYFQKLAGVGRRRALGRVNETTTPAVFPVGSRALNRPHVLQP